MKRRSIYLIRKRALGDVLWIEPVIRQLASRYRKVIVHTRYNGLFENYPLANVVFKPAMSFFEKLGWTIESWLRRSFFFINLEQAYEKRPKMHFLHAYQQAAGLPMTTEYPRIYFSEAEQAKVNEPAGRFVTLHLDTYANMNYRNVYGVDWEAIVAYLAGKNITVYQIGKSDQLVKGAKHINTTVREMMVLIKKSLFFIGIDSGPSHIAASLGVPSLVFFGSVNPEYRHFKSLFKGFILQQPCEFAGCYHETPGKEPVICRLVGSAGVPKCSQHSAAFVKTHIDMILKEWV